MSIMARYEARRVSSPGASLDVRHYAGSGEPIVLLHGGPGMGNYLGSLADVLSPPFQVVSYDQRGCGASTDNGSFGIDEQLADLDAVRVSLGAARVHLLGHSYGGLLAQLYAKAHPDRVASLVLCCSMANTGPKVSQMESRGINERVMKPPKRSSVAWAVGGLLMQFPGKVGDRGFGIALQQMMPNYVVRRERAPAFEAGRASKRAWRGTNASVKALGDDYLAGLSIPAPVLIVQGDQDVIRETNAVLAARFPSAANVRIADAAHFPWLEQPDAFAAAVLPFYRDFG